MQAGVYWQARERLPEEFFLEVARQTGRTLDADADPQWFWKGRRVYLFDGLDAGYARESCGISST
ncbi:hypothetical protein GC176_21670 [bacterium]|nr:hypothetical protein [bacterium]